MFEGFEGERMKVKMQKPRWIKGSQEQDECGKTCIIKDLDKKHQEKARRDLQIYRSVGQQQDLRGHKFLRREW